MLANLVASHPNITASNEVPRPVLMSILNLMDAADAAYGKSRGRADPWETIRQDFFLNVVANTYGPGARRSVAMRKRFSNKTPSLELLYKKIASYCSTEKPQFIYCVRHPKKVLRSLKNMPWGSGSIEDNLKVFERSTVCLKQMQNDDAVSVHVVQIDKVGETKSDRLAFSKSLFDYLGEEITDEVIAHTEEWAPAQPATEVLKVEKLVEFDESELAVLERSDIYKKLCAQFGYEE